MTKRLVGTLVVLLLTGVAIAQKPGAKAQFNSTRAKSDVVLDSKPDSAFWRNVTPVYMEVDTHGRSEPEYRTEVRSRWTEKYVYFLFICPYKELYLKPDPDTSHETFKLWDWNVAEVFLGTDFKNIQLYKEFEISPHGEWIDLDIDLRKPHHEEGWVWNSGFEHQARIDEAKHTWYAVLKIPFAALGVAKPKVGTTFRANLYRTEGPPNDTKAILWQPTMTDTFHAPEKFGLMRLAAQ